MAKKVKAEFTGDSGLLPAQPPTAEDLILRANAELIEYINSLHRRINELEG